MNSVERIPVLGPGRVYEYERRNIGVDSSNLIQYLRGALPDQNYHVFAEKLYLGRYEPHIKSLHTAINEVYRLDEEKRQGKKQEIDVLPRGNIFQRLVADLSEDEMLRQINETAQGEVLGYITNDVQTGAIEATESIKGTYGQVEANFLSLYRDMILMNKLPLIEMHRHPNNSLFSAPDYRSLLVNLGYGRLIRGILVVCPDIQILALPTAQTPLYNTYDEARQAIREKKQQLEELISQRTKADKNRYHAILQQNDYYQDAMVEQVNQQIPELERFMAEHPLSEGEFSRTILAIVHQMNPRFVDDMENRRKFRHRVFEQYQKSFQKAIVEAGVQVARDMHVKLYTSTNFTLFDAA